MRAALAARPAPRSGAAARAHRAARSPRRASPRRRGERAASSVLAAIFPDAPARASDLFDDADRDAFDAGRPAGARPRFAWPGPASSRAGIPRAASALLRSLGPDLPARVARRRPPTPGSSRGVRATRSASSPSVPPTPARRSRGAPPGRALVARRDAPHWAISEPSPGAPRSPRARPVRRRPRPRVSEKEKAAAGVRLAALDALLARPLVRGGPPPAPRGRSPSRLEDRARRRRPPPPRAALSHSTRRRTPARRSGSPTAWARYTGGDFAGAARLFDEQIPAYRGAFLRRRATYWSARAHEKVGDDDAPRARSTRGSCRAPFPTSTRAGPPPRSA